MSIWLSIMGYETQWLACKH